MPFLLPDFEHLPGENLIRVFDTVDFGQLLICSTELRGDFAESVSPAFTV
jgi:hypothetical protein